LELPYISVLLPARNEGSDLAACLESLAAQTYPLDRFEVIIADGSDSPIPLTDLPDELDVRILRNPERVMSRGLNLAARAARGERFAIVSAHSWLPPDYLLQMYATARDSGAANVGSRVKKAARSAWGRAIAAATSSRLGVGGSIQHFGSVAGRADSAFPGFIDRAAFDAVGGFNGELACNEDDEFNARLRAAGYIVWYDPAVEVSYRPRETLAGVFRQYFRYGRWKVAVARTGLPGYLRLRHAMPAAAVLTGGLLAVGSIRRRGLRLPLVGLTVLYGFLAGAEGRRLAPAQNAVPWRVAATFPVIHTAYGLGFLRGLLDSGMPDEGQPPLASPEDGDREVTRSEVAYRNLTMLDVPGAARLHREVFADYFLGHMGQKFLEVLYREFVGMPGNHGVVAIVDGKVAGAVIGSSDLARFYSGFYRRHFAELGVRFAVQVARDGYIRRHMAARLPHVATALRSRLGLGRPMPTSSSDEPAAQLLSIGVSDRRRGLGIAGELTRRFCDLLQDEGVVEVGLTVFNENTGAIAFYQKTGWQRRPAGPVTTAFVRDLRPSGMHALDPATA
jgi:succinoglycan biosynthesis protein ExoA